MSRFQADESVQKTISNTMRYHTSRAEKDTYQQDLGRCRWLFPTYYPVSAEQVREKRGREAEEREWEAGARQHEVTTWGGDELTLLPRRRWRGGSGASRGRGEPTGGARLSRGRALWTRWSEGGRGDWGHLNNLSSCRVTPAQRILESGRRL